MLHPIVAARPSYLSEPAVVEEEEGEEEGDGERDLELGIMTELGVEIKRVAKK